MLKSTQFVHVYCMYGVQENQICPTISFCLLCPTYVEKKYSINKYIENAEEPMKDSL